MSNPWRIWIVFAGEHIRKWAHEPFDLDGVKATEFQVASIAGLHTCNETCNRPRTVVATKALRRIAELERTGG